MCVTRDFAMKIAHCMAAKNINGVIQASIGAPVRS
jgi:hypothetical protein